MGSHGRRDLNFLVIVTFGRTGSTVLQAALNAHPHTIIRGENYGAVRGIEMYVRAVSEAADRHHSGSPTHPWYGTARLNPAAILESQREHVIEHLLRPKSDTRWSGYKEVRFEIGHFPDSDSLTSHLLFIHQLLPGVRIIFNTRDPKDAAGSGWWPQHPDAEKALATTVANLQESADVLTQIVGPDRVVVLEYSRWKDDPDFLVEQLRSIGFPAESSIVKHVLAEQLTHGPARRCK